MVAQFQGFQFHETGFREHTCMSIQFQVRHSPRLTLASMSLAAEKFGPLGPPTLPAPAEGM